jgi:type VI secretion system protein ImpF
MAKSDPEVSVQPPLLDRLIDLDPGSGVEPPQSRAMAVRALKDALRRDLEWLLNTRRTPIETPKVYDELVRSVFYYGLPDLSSISLHSQQDETQLLAMIEKAIANFEPRLAQVRVTPREPLDRRERMLHFQIDALLLVDPAPESVSFDTVLNVDRGNCEVKG